PRPAGARGRAPPGVELLGRSSGGRGEPPVEMAPPAERAADQLGAEGGIARLEPRMLQRVLEDDVGESAILLHAHEDAERLVARLGDGARAQHRTHAWISVTRAPAESRAPRRKSSHAMALRFSGWTWTGRRRPSLVATAGAPATLEIILPGGAAEACGAAVARQIRSRPAGVMTAAPGHGFVPRMQLT